MVTKFFFLGLGNTVHSYMQSIKSLSAFCIKCNIRNADEQTQISLMSAIYFYDYIKLLMLKTCHKYYCKIYYLSSVLCTAIFNFCRQAIYRKLTTENLVKHGFLRPQDMSLTETVTKFFFLWVQQNLTRPNSALDLRRGCISVCEQSICKVQICRNEIRLHKITQCNLQEVT